MTSISTPLPANLNEVDTICALHNHELMIKIMCPNLISSELASGDPASHATYNVVDKNPISQVSLKITLTNVDGGVDSVVAADSSIGALTVTSAWRVKDGALKEDITVDGNMVTKKIGRSNVEKAHPDMQRRLLEQAAAKA